MSGGSTTSDILGGLQAAAGLGASIMGNPAVGLPLAMGGLSGLFGGGQGTAAGAANALGPQQPSGWDQAAQGLTQMAPALQTVTNALGLNPQNRPQTATAPQTGLQTPPNAGGRQAQSFQLPQMQQPVQAAGAMSNVPAGAGTAPMGGMAGGAGQNQSVQQILAALGFPVRSY